jgi:Notch-like protein
MYVSLLLIRLDLFLIIFLATGCTPPCLNGGQCQQSGANISLCVCPSDYTGDQCQTSVLGKNLFLFFYKDKQLKSFILSLATHPCVTTPNLCQNGGTCTMNGADYLCNCPIGWAGMNCETQDSMLFLYK